MENTQTEHLDNVEELIEALKVLKVQESALKIRETALITRLEAATKKGKSGPTTTTTASKACLVPNSTLVRGDRVRIKARNKVRKPATWDKRIPWSEDKERTATVTRVTPTQIHFITDNGVETWRAPNNIYKIAK
jgi:hypothetical protein